MEYRFAWNSDDDTLTIRFHTQIHPPQGGAIRFDAAVINRTPPGESSTLNAMNEPVYIRMSLISEADDGMGLWGIGNVEQYEIPVPQRLLENPANPNDPWDTSISNNVFATISVPAANFNAPQFLANLSAIDIQIINNGPYLSGEIPIANMRFAHNA